MPAITVSSAGVILWKAHKARCALGSSGLRAAHNKHEGDGTTPTGEYFLRRILYRADRTISPQSTLSGRALRKDDGWCDDPADPAYNRPIALPYPASCEALWRDDHVYDLIGVLSHNDAPPIAGFGSAVFIHLARPDYSPTRGCMALAEADLRALFAYANTAIPILIG